MKYEVYSSPGCIRCSKVKQKLLEQDHEISHHTAEYHSLPSDPNWRKRMDDFAGFRGQLARQNDELPVVRCVDSGEFLSCEEIEKFIS